MNSTKNGSHVAPATVCVAAIICGPIGAWVMGTTGQFLETIACSSTGMTVLLLVSPIAEEVIFRIGVHSYMAQRFPGCLLQLSAANLLTALLFGATHVVLHGTLTNLLVAAPALLIGWCWEISGKRITAAILLHSWFNFCLAWMSC